MIEYIWARLGKCTHCGRDIEGRPAYEPGAFIIEGLEPMEYRHIDDMKNTCSYVIRNKCEPHNNWGKRSEWGKAQLPRI